MFMIQCEDLLSLNNTHDITKIGKCWHQRKGVTRSTIVGVYVTPNIFNFYNIDLNNDDDNKLYGFDMYYDTNNNELDDVKSINDID